MQAPIAVLARSRVNPHDGIADFKESVFSNRRDDAAVFMPQKTWHRDHRVPSSKCL
jgi:hypothetical protein